MRIQIKCTQTNSDYLGVEYDVVPLGEVHVFVRQQQHELGVVLSPERLRELAREAIKAADAIERCSEELAVIGARRHQARVLAASCWMSRLNAEED